MTTILLADDHPVVRRGIRSILEREPDLEIIGETGDGLEAVKMAGKLNPDVVVADMMMPGLTGLEVARQISQQFPASRVLLFSIHSNEAYVIAALKNGAAGYVLKDSSADELITAVQDVAKGKRYLSDSLADRVIDLYLRHIPEDLSDPYESLTNREREVLKLSAEGLSNPEIGERLCISSRTVETHRQNLMRKTNLQNQAELIRYAIRRGILPVD